MKTWNIIYDIIDQNHIPIYKNWRSNEKHCGVLIGINKEEISRQYREEQVKIWRRDICSKPPALDKNDPRNPLFDHLFSDYPKKLLPLTEVNKFNLQSGQKIQNLFSFYKINFSNLIITLEIKVKIIQGLEDNVIRVFIYLNDVIVPNIQIGKKIILCALEILLDI